MKRMVKSGLPFVMSLCMVMSSMSVPADIDAAKKIKLSKKSVTVTKGKSKTVAIKNVKAKKVKKLVVKSSKKKTVAAKKSGKTKVKVTGKKVGNAKVTVKLTLKGKKKAVKLTLKVKVKSAAKKPGTGQTAAPGTSQTTAPGSTQTAVPGGTQTAAPGGTQTAAPSPSAGTDKTPAPSAGTADTPAPSAGTDKTPTPSAGTDKTPAPSASVTDGKTYELPLTAENVKADGDSSAVSFKDSTAVIKVTGKYSGVILTMPAGVAGEYDMVTVSYKGGNGKCGSALRKDGTDQDIRWGGQFPATETVKEVQHISTSGTVNGYKIFCNEEDLATNPLEITITKVVFSNSKDLPPTPAPSAGADNTPAPSAGAADTPAPSAGADNTPAPSAGAADTPTPSAGAAGTPTPPVQLEPGEEEIDGVVCKTYPMVETMDYEIVKPGVETEKIELPLTELPNLLNKITDLAGTYSKWMGTVEYSKTVNGVSFDITTEDEDHMETKKVVVSGSVNDRLNGEFEVSVEKKAEAVYQVKITKDGAAEPRTLTITKNSDRVIIESTYNGTAYKVDAANDKKTITVYTDGTTLLGKLMKTEGEGAYKLALSKEEVEKRGLKVQESTKQDIPPQPETEIMAEVTLADTAVIAGETTEATAEITVIGSTAEKQITWSSLNENVATVAPKADDPAKAIVTAKEAGTATIKVTVEAGGKSQEATVAINVKEALTVTGGAIKVPDQPIFVGKTAQLKVEGITTNGTISKTEWTVDAADQAKAEIDATTGVITAKQAGTIKVTATVTVAGELGQKKEVVINGTVTIGLAVPINNDTLCLTSYLPSSIQNNSDGVTFTMSRDSGGGGVAFYLNSTDHSKISLENYSGVEMTYATERSGVPLVFGMYETDESVWAPGLDVWGDGVYFTSNGQEQTYKVAFNETKVSGKQALAIRVKYNTWQHPKPVNQTITIKSLTLKGKEGTPDLAVALESSNQCLKDGVAGAVSFDENGATTTLSQGQYGGGGLAFYVKEDWSSVDLSEFKEVRIKLSTQNAKVPLCIKFYADATDLWNGACKYDTDKVNNKGEKELGDIFCTYSNSGESGECEWVCPIDQELVKKAYVTVEKDAQGNVTKEIHSNMLQAIRISYNTYNLENPVNQEITIKSIELIPKDEAAE